MCKTLSLTEILLRENKWSTFRCGSKIFKVLKSNSSESERKYALWDVEESKVVQITSDMFSWRFIEVFSKEELTSKCNECRYKNFFNKNYDYWSMSLIDFEKLSEIDLNTLARIDLKTLSRIDLEVLSRIDLDDLADFLEERKLEKKKKKRNFFVRASI